MWASGGLGSPELVTGQARTAGVSVCVRVHVCMPVCLCTRVPAYVLYMWSLHLWSLSLSNLASSELLSGSFTINSFTKL